VTVVEPRELTLLEKGEVDETDLMEERFEEVEA